ncbi:MULTISPECIES: N-acetylmuramoyl-L-alanine amidase [Corynebacterium]|uniref:N-acetylmuramoyl-L-alanine amidase n=1 Tax=Corynebacterium TaxID=1716 RepID=UPI0008A2F47D|nr:MULTISPECIES: N-acetylmuramoyl-L-alanine amidase [Corynebacterium]MDK7199593.1 N-acetylmuramoyl-L-alanine amidase [Corynebacterium amycolatum]OFM50110.1 hypothetical protein HMPREF2681_06670 [Corynebacterium sp. HMSC064H12]OFQ00379.1 hypothetical protein HMPREF2960_02485 [Corynebacterium sp. HMSC070B05]
MFSRRRINRRAGAKQSLVLAAVATLALTPVAVVGAGAAYDLIEENGAGPIDPVVQSKSLADSVSVLVEDAAIATQSLADEAHPNRGVVKEITSDTEFSQFALTWAGDPDIASFVRAERADGSWSDWFSVDPDYPAEGNGNGLNGTELIYIEPTKRVQVSTHGLNIFGPGSGVDLKDIKGAEKLDLSKLNLDEINAEDAKKAVEDAKDSATDAAKDVAEAVDDATSDYQQTPDAAPGDALDDPTAPSANDAANLDSPNLPVKWTDIEPVADELPIDQVDAVLIDGQAAASGIDPIVDAKNVTGMPKVITRAGWGANENNRCKGADYDSKLVGATVHHTAGSNNYTESQSAGIVRGIYQYHAQTLGWCDIGYNALVDKYGNIYEGRYGGLDKNVQGAHAGGFNTGTFGISMMGNYSSVAPSEAALNSVGNMIGWRLKVAGIKPTGQIQMTSGGTSYAKYGYGQQVTLPTIFAHRDVGNTTCPGDAGYAQMSKIRSIAEKKYNTLTSGKIDNEGPDGLIDLLVPQDEKDDKTAEDTDSQSSESTESSTSTSTTSTTSTTSASTGTSTTSSSEKSSSASSTTSSTTSSSDSTTSGTSDTSEPTDATNTGDTASADSSAPSASEQSNSSSPSASDEQQKAQALETVSGARSMLASALGMLGAPGLGQTADAILGAVGRSIENGPSIADLPVLIDKIITINEQNDLAAEWRQVSEEMGSVLGYAMSGIQSGSTVANNAGQADALRYVKFSNGVITDSDTTGAHAIWGKIADEWARQGFEVGKLGAPTKTQVVDGNIERAEFQNGSITFDRTTGEVKTELK